MSRLLVATASGLRVFTAAGEAATELPGCAVGALATSPDGGCLAVVGGREIWRRSREGVWTKAATAGLALQSVAAVGGVIFGGGEEEAAVVRVRPDGLPERLGGLDRIAGRETWFASGPPLGVRSLTAAADKAVLLAAVHVGGIPRSEDGGETWTPTVPIAFDVHEVRAHPTLPGFAAAAAAVGLCVSRDGGRNWSVYAEGLEFTGSLAVAVLEDEVLFSIQDGPFAKRSQVWRWRIGGQRVEPVGGGLPPWLEGKVDTGGIAAGCGHAAVADRGGNLWRSREGSAGWERIASGLPCVAGMAFV